MTLHLGVALDRAGWHPAAWREPGAEPRRLFDAGYWVALAQRAEEGLLDVVSFEDTFGAPGPATGGGGRADRVSARPDAALVAARVATATRHIGLLPVVTTTWTEPFHVASATSTLDWVSGGRAGWQARVSGRPEDAALLGTRPPPARDEVFAEAADVVDAVRRLWDSWEDDAIVRDVATGRFVDRERLHYVDMERPTFSVKGPSIVPRPPQGQPVVAVLAHVPAAYDLAATAADLVFVTPGNHDDIAIRLAEVRAAEARAGRASAPAADAATGPVPLRVLADLAVVLAPTAAAAAARRDALDELDGAPWHPDAAVFAGTADELADRLVAGRDAGLDGWRLRPAVLPRDLDAIVTDLVPALQRRGAFRTAPPGGTLRERLGLPRPASRYAGSAR